MNHEQIIKYLEILLTFPVLAFIAFLIIIIIYKQSIKAFLDKINELIIKSRGTEVTVRHGDIQSDTSNTNPNQKDLFEKIEKKEQELEQVKTESEGLKKAFTDSLGLTRFWRQQYISKSLARTSIFALSLLYQKGLEYSDFKSKLHIYLSTLNIENTEVEANAILDALTKYNLVQILDNNISITPEGKSVYGILFPPYNRVN